MRPVRMIASACLLIGLAVPAAGRAEAPTPAASPSLPAITVAEVAPAMLRDRVFASGLVTPVETVQVQPLIEGQPIEALLADVGDTVAAGQVLARLSDARLRLQGSQLQAQQASAEAAIAQAAASRIEAESSAQEAERVRARTTALRSQGTATEAQADTAQAQATAAEARLTAARQGERAAEAQRALVAAQIADNDLQLQRTQVIAPVAGIVTARNAQVGAVASAGGTAMFTMIRDGALELRVDLAEQDVLRVAPGQGVALRAVGLSEPLTGKVRLVEPTVDPATRLGRVRIAIDRPELVRAGLYAEAEILVAEAEALTIPAAAIGVEDGQPSVLRVGPEGRVEAVTVTTGIRDGGRVGITAGLAAGDRIVARAGAFVRPGDRINPVDAPPAGH